MKAVPDHPLALFIGLIAATWPVWRWYVLRLGDGSDEQRGLLALGAVIAPALGRRTAVPLPASLLPVLTGLLAVCALCLWWAPPLVRAIPATLALGVLASATCIARLFHPGLAGLLLLALPVGASMQYCLGYPLRLAATAIAAPLIRLAGFAVEAHGVSLNWPGETVLLDAPCSGVRMLWTGLFMASFLAVWLGFGLWRTLGSLVGAAGAVVLANGIRNAVLFFRESAIVPMPDWAHEGIGLGVFAAAAGAVLLLMHLLDRRAPCSAA
ncbi:MAG TPA: archaeosortase/exosortase family protein [Acidobacteriota bacterium]|nr:archaeosortase/exosortase family protein [Acidobacteriota bacterium]HQG90518.1 archaeosortase/exosortase family protein [Acidobacteriota bacterium]